MKNIKHITIAIVALQLLFQFSSSAQLRNDVGQKNQNRRIASFIQAWGLVKYKAPISIEGHWNADSVFLFYIDPLRNASQGGFDSLLIKFIKPVATFQSAERIQRSANVSEAVFKKNIDFGWINLSGFSPGVKKSLKKITESTNASGKHHYIPEVWYEGKLPNEPAYPSYEFNNQAMNLLALAKAWNAVEYLFPYKYQMDRPWKKILLEMVPVFWAVHDRTGYERALLQLEVALNDSHGGEFLERNNMKMVSKIFKVRYYPPFDYKAEPGRIIVKKFLNDSLALLNTLKAGDEILSVNGEAIKSFLLKRSALLPASNQAVKYRALSPDYDNGDTFAFADLPGSTLTVGVRRQGKRLTLMLKMLDRRDERDVKSIQNYLSERKNTIKAIAGREELSPDITLFRAGSFFDKDLPNKDELSSFSRELMSKKAIVFDMRQYPQSPGLFSFYIPRALGKAPFAFARYYAVNLRDPGSFIHRAGAENYMNVSGQPLSKTAGVFKGQIIILTNEHTQSMGEWFTMMLRQLNDHTTIIGSQTAGADGDLKKLNLPGGYRFSFTGNAVFLPKGGETQRVGIKPDINFRQTASQVAGDSDAQLEQALSYIITGGK